VRSLFWLMSLAIWLARPFDAFVVRTRAESIQSPEVPFALRMSGHLLVSNRRV
jgi:hypothetical protein